MRIQFKTILCGCAVFLCVVSCSSADADDGNWPQFRGPGSAGTVDRGGLPETWDREANVIWKRDIPGRSWSSPIVWGNRVFLTTVVSEGGQEKVKKGLYFGGERKRSKDVHRWLVYCLDRDTGKVVWNRAAHHAIPGSSIHLKNSLASETPVTDGKRVYAYFGSPGLFCYDFDGELLWSRKWGEFPTKLGWGTAASPVLHEGRVYVVNDNEKASFLEALDAETGDPVWRVDRDEKTNWATPFVWKNDRRTELITPGAGKVRSYSMDGKVLWQLGGMSSLTIPTPFAKFGLLYVTSGYVLDRRKPIFAIRPGAAGDISLTGDQTSNDGIAWSQKMAGPYNTSPVIYGDNLYVLYDRGLFAVYNAKTGKEIYGKRRIGTGARAFTSSPWAYDGKIFCLSEDGVTYVIGAGSEFQVLRKNDLDELCMATPAISGRSLFIRTESQLYRIEQR